MEETVVVQVYSVSTTIDLKQLRSDAGGLSTKRYGQHSLCIALSEEEQFWVFRFGAVVFVNVPEERHEELLKRFGLIEVHRACFQGEDFVEDDCLLVFTGSAPKVQFNKIELPDWEGALLYIVTRVLAQSCRLEVLENEVAEVLTESATLTEQLKESSWKRSRRKDIQCSLGDILKMRHDMISRLLLLHEPESTWENEQCDSLYRSLFAHYELERRFADVEKMLSVASDSGELQLGLLDTRRSEFLEIIIIVLILFEVVHALIDAFFA
jgi:uncharacterized Rmd1/YagE family protein